MATVKLDPAKGVQIPNLTTTERDAISSPETGALIWNTTTSAINQYNGSAWEATDTNTQADITGKLNLSGGTMTGNLLTNSSSKIGIGTASPAKSLHVQGNVLIDNPNNGYGGFRIKDDSGGDYNVYLDTGRNQSGTRIWMRHGARVQGTTPWTDATPSNICSFGQGGIAFGSDTAAANTLDDYEEGEYTYTITGNTGGSMTPRANYTKFSYTKIGSMVHVQGKFETSGAHNATGYLKFSLPFTSANLTDQAGSSAGAFFLYRTGLANIYNPTPFLPDNYNIFLVYYNTISNNEVNTLDGGDVDSSIEGFVSITYRAA